MNKNKTKSWKDKTGHLIWFSRKGDGWRMTWCRWIEVKRKGRNL